MSRDLSVRDFVDAKMRSGEQVRSFVARIQRDIYRTGMKRLMYFDGEGKGAEVFGRLRALRYLKVKGAEVFGRLRALRCLEGEGC